MNLEPDWLAAQVPLEKLFVDFEAQIESVDGDEELFVSEKGGNSSSFATTMICNKEGEHVEWSVTGRIGVSLAQLSGANDLAFSFRRAKSHLVEMGGKEWDGDDKRSSFDRQLIPLAEHELGIYSIFWICSRICSIKYL